MQMEGDDLECAHLFLLFSDQLRKNCGLKYYFLEVNVQDMMSFNETLASLLIKKPNEYVPLVSVLLKRENDI